MASTGLKSTIWIGNIDSKATEAQILKLVQPHGKIVKFDFIYGLKEPSSTERIPKGYAFVTYDNYVSADSAIRSLNGIQVLSKSLKVQLSSSTAPSLSSMKSSNSSSSVPLSLSVSLNKNPKKSVDNSKAAQKIKAMEAKLKALERNSASGSEFHLAVPGASGTSIKRHDFKPYERPNRKSK